MNKYEHLKNSYISAVLFGLTMNVSYDEAKLGNEILHKLCKIFIDNSGFCDIYKSSMKNELNSIKDMLSMEIECSYTYKIVYNDCFIKHNKKAYTM